MANEVKIPVSLSHLSKVYNLKNSPINDKTEHRSLGN